MLQKPRHRAVLLIAFIPGLAGSCLLTGCQTWFERFYQPAPTSSASENHLEKARQPSETIAGLPMCGPMASHYFTFATVPEGQDAARLATPDGRFTDILSESGAGTAPSEVPQLSIGPVVPPTIPQLAWSIDPAGDGNRLAQEGYVLIGTSSFTGWGYFFSQTQQGLQQATQQALAQGNRVRASVVLLDLPFTTVCVVRSGGAASNPLEPRLLLGAWTKQPHINGTVFASYWARAGATEP